MPSIVQRHLHWLVVIWVLAAPVASAAQQVSAVVEGVIQDQSAAIISGVGVTLRNLDTNQTRTTLTDDRGHFRFADIAAGSYSVLATVDGFETFELTPLMLAIGQTVHLPVTMRPAGLIENVSVSAQPAPLDPRQTGSTTSIDAERIEELPVRSRNYLEFVLLAPGVSRPARQSTVATASATLPDSGFSFGGLRPRSNTLTIDGLDNNDEVTGATRTELSLEFIREFQVVTNGWSAENGGAAGGGINVITKSGANVRHGDVFLFGQSGAINARPKLEETLGQSPSLERYRGGIAAGGPIVKDRAFYYFAGEREHTDDQAASDIGPKTALAINRALDTARLPDVGTRALTLGLFAMPRSETEAAAKLTQQLPRAGSVTGRVATTRSVDTNNAFNTGGLSDRSVRGTRSTSDRGATGSWMSVIGSSVTQELRAQWATRRIDQVTAEQDGPQVAIAGSADFGAAYLGNGTRDQTYFDLSETLAHGRGSHFLKAGAAVKRVAVSTTTAIGGLYAFRTVETFLGGGAPEQVRMLSASDVEMSATRASVFVQDHWTPRAGLTVDGGARFDTTLLPSQLAISNRQISPRVGVAWTPSSRWVVRGGAGRFADRIPLAALEPSLQERRESVTLSGPVAPSIYTVRPGAWQPSSQQAGIAVERQLSTNTTITANYLFVRGRHLLRTVNVNLRPPTLLTDANASSLGIDAPLPQQLGRLVFGRERLDPRWDGVFELQPTASSTHRALMLTANKRLADEVEWSVAYTWSHTMDSASDFDEQPQNPYALADEWSDSLFDQRHRLVINALFDIPIGEEEDRVPGQKIGKWIQAFSHLEAAPILAIESGHPVNITTGGDDNQLGAFPFTARPLAVRRNALRLPSAITLDMRLLKYFAVKSHGKLDLVVEAFNVLNRTNRTQLNSVYGSLLTPLRSFGRAIEAAPARQFQFSIDLEF